MRRLFVLGVAFALLAGMMTSAGGQEAEANAQAAGVVPGRYVVVMAADPLVTTFGQDQLDTAAARNRGQALKASHDQALQSIGRSPNAKVHDYTVSLNGFAAALTEAEAEKIAHAPGVAVVLPDVRRFPTTDSSPDFLGLTAPGGAYEKGFDGSGVVVGIIDTGIWPEHPSFADDGSYATPPTGPIPCEFGNTAHNPHDAPFTCNNKLIGARQVLATYRDVIGADPDEFDSARDDAGHGTHTASTAAGNAGVAADIFDIPRGTISGIAPRAHIIAYKGLGNQGGFGSDLAAAIDLAVEDGVDVINYSIGGGPSLIGADDVAFLFAAAAGVFVANSAGNDGPNAGTIGGPASVPWITTVGASTQSRFFQGTVVLGNGAEYAGASITAGTGVLSLVDAEDHGNSLCDPAVPFTGDVSGKIVLCERGVVARVAKSLAVFNAGGAGMVQFNTNDVGDLATDNHWVPSVHVDLTPGQEIKAYIDQAGEAATAQIFGEQLSEWPSAPSMAIFSSRGPDPVALDIIKPDITAPGQQILAGYSPFPDPGTEPPGELFAAIQGTSMSGPHVAGVFALLKQAHPDWSAAMAKSALMTTASQDVVDNDRVSATDPFDRGSGHIDVGGHAGKGSPFEPGLIYDAGFNEYLGFLCDEEPSIFLNPAATCAALAAAGIPTEAENLNYPSIGIAAIPGSKTVTRTVTSLAPGNQSFNVTVNAPAGYNVEVSPARLRLRQGQSASYQVTVTNVGAPIGEWRFGSLSWSDGSHYDVYSPIAVRASDFESASVLEGTGTDGEITFPISFGYSGDYDAAAHGLVEEAVISDTVVQDPDQNFNPSDGFSNSHTFELTDVLYFRIAIPPDATEPNADLDVYVFNPSGQLAAASTLGGTNELVNITTPADGTWTVWVHGWQAPGGDSPYDLSSWVVPSAEDGSLSVTTEPESAVIGTVGNITVAWSGLTADREYFGAVSHNRGGELLGITVVEVQS